MAFARAEANLQAIEQSLADLSAQEQEIVNAGLREAVAEMGVGHRHPLIRHHPDLEPP